MIIRNYTTYLLGTTQSIGKQVRYKKSGFR